MNSLEFTFEKTPWEATLDTLRPGDSLPALRFLTLLEGESEEALEDAFKDLEERHISLDVAELPKSVSTGAAEVRLRREAELIRQGKLLEGLEEDDPLRLYLEEIAALPRDVDLQVLARRCAEGDQTAMTALTNACLPKVVSLAKKLAGNGVLLLDLIQEGSLGLWQSILSWREGDFASYSDWWIRQTLAKTLTLQARANGVGQKLVKELEDYRAVDRRLLTQLGRNPTLEEIALELNISGEDAAVLEKMLADAKTEAKMNAPQTQEREDPEADMAVEDTAYFQSRQRILTMLSGLEEAEAHLLTLRFGLEGGLPLSPQDTGARLGLTPEEVVAQEAAVLAKLREQR